MGHKSHEYIDAKGEPKQSKHSKAKNKDLESIIAINFDFMFFWIKVVSLLNIFSVT